MNNVFDEGLYDWSLMLPLPDLDGELPGFFA